MGDLNKWWVRKKSYLFVWSEQNNSGIPNSGYGIENDSRPPPSLIFAPPKMTIFTRIVFWGKILVSLSWYLGEFEGAAKICWPGFGHYGAPNTESCVGGPINSSLTVASFIPFFGSLVIWLWERFKPPPLLHFCLSKNDNFCDNCFWGKTPCEPQRIFRWDWGRHEKILTWFWPS